MNPIAPVRPLDVLLTIVAVAAIWPQYLASIRSLLEPVQCRRIEWRYP